MNPKAARSPRKKCKALKDSLKQDHPGVLTAVAMLRPQMVAAYRDAADIFMIDPYPVPNMPMTWMSDTLEEAARHVPQERLWAVIQAFGGDKVRQGRLAAAPHLSGDALPHLSGLGPWGPWFLLL